MSLSVVVLAAVVFLISFRRIGRIRLAMWQSMSLGAIAVVATGQISIGSAVGSVNLDVMGFLFGMFVVGRALEASGYLASAAQRIFGGARSVDALVLMILFGMGIASTLLMNDTVAIIGTPVVLLLARRLGLSPRLLLLTLAFAITIGSAMSPIGNPQNLLVAIEGDIRNPFIQFLGHLALPTLASLLLAHLFLRVSHWGEFRRLCPAPPETEPGDPDLGRLAGLSLLLVVALILAKIVTVFAGLESIDFRLTYIAAAGVAPIALFSRHRARIVRTIDWHTLAFFAAMFVLMRSVWESGFFQGLIDGSGLDVASVPVVMVVSIALSQVMSNVPLVALYLPGLLHAGASVDALLALAAGSTIAGNLTILGAASNVIIIQGAEDRDGGTITFLDFARVGLPLTLVVATVYWVFLDVL